MTENPVRSYDPARFFRGDALTAAAAIQRGDLPTLAALLLSKPTLAAAIGEQGMTMLFWAALLAEIDALMLLIKAGADPNQVIKLGGSQTQLIALAAAAESDPLFDALLAAGADPNGQSDGDPALFGAIHAGRTDRIHRLLDAGADIDRPSRGGSPPIIYLAKINEYALVEALLARGADIHARDLAGARLIDYARRFRLSPDTVNGRAHARVLHLLLNDRGA